MLRVNQPTFTVVPTLTIKQQWVGRFVELFLQHQFSNDRFR